MCKGTEVDKEFAIKKEVESARALAEVMAEMCPFKHESTRQNGRCEYHEELRVEVSKLTGGINTMKWAIGIGMPILIFLATINFGLLFSHMSKSVPPPVKKTASISATSEGVKAE